MPINLEPLLLPAVVTGPLVWLLLTLLWRRMPPLITALGVVLQILAASLLCWWTLTLGASYHFLGGWVMPLGIPLRLDGLAAAFLLLNALVAGGCAFHARFYLAGRPAAVTTWFWPLFWFLWAALNCLWLSEDLFNLYVCLELMTLAAVGLVAISGELAALGAALRYLLAALAGSLCYLVGVGLLYAAHGSLALPLITQEPSTGSSFTIALALMTGGLLFKTALFPLHGWLPPAHGQALGPVSALLSGLVIKGSFYILLRLWLDLGSGGQSQALPLLLGLLGTLAIIWGSWLALRQESLKQIVAYSTVAQVGYFFLYFPLAADVSEASALVALTGTLLMLLAHGLAKAAMFLAATNMILAIGEDRLGGLTSISHFRPLPLFSFGLASLTIMGLPPSGGFTAKWLLLQAALFNDRWGWALVIVFGGLLSAAYVFRVFRQCFREGPSEDIFHHPTRWLELSPMLLALASVLLGLLAAAPLALLEVTVARPGGGG